METSPGNLYLMPREREREREGKAERGREGERGREINGDPLGSYTKGKVKVFSSFTLTVFLQLPLPLSI